MATALTQFNRAQVGIEVVSTKGTIVPATRQIVGDHTFVEEQTFYRSPYPIAVLANVGGAGVIVRKSTLLTISTELTAEEILWPLMTGVAGSVTGSVTDTSAYTWLFTPLLTTGVKVIQSASIEFARGDGTTNHYLNTSGYGMTQSFQIDWAAPNPALLKWTMFARARQTAGLTAAIVPYPTREPLSALQLQVFWDTSYATLGNTALAGMVRSGSFVCTTGYAPDYTLDGRADTDFGVFKVGPIVATLSLVVEFEAVAALKFAQFRLNSLQYIRLTTLGSLAGSATAYKTVRIDGAYRFTTPPAFSADGAQVLCTIALESVFDVTGSKSLEFQAINKLSAIT